MTGQSRPIIIGVAGGTGSGKTTVAHSILEKVGWNRIALIQHDSYYFDASNLPLAERSRLNFDHPDALETSLFVEHLKRLRSGVAVEIPVYDFRIHTRSSETRRVEPEPVILVEGILILQSASCGSCSTSRSLWMPTRTFASSAGSCVT